MKYRSVNREFILFVKSFMLAGAEMVFRPYQEQKITPFLSCCRQRPSTKIVFLRLKNLRLYNRESKLLIHALRLATPNIKRASVLRDIKRTRNLSYVLGLF